MLGLGLNSLPRFTAYACGGKYDCVMEHIRAKWPFDEKGVLQGEIELKAVKDGKFVKLSRGGRH